MATRTPSLKNQIDHALRSIFRPNESRHQAKAAGQDGKHMHSYGTLDRYRQACRTLLTTLPRDERPKYLRDLTDRRIARGINLLREKGNSNKTLKTQRNAWRRLGHALNHLGWSTRDPHALVPGRLYADLEPARPQGPISPQQVTQWRERVSERASQSHQYGADLIRMFDLLHTTGLRIDACARLRTDMLDRSQDVIHIRANIAKNGRPRDISIDTDAARAAIDAIPTGRHYLWVDGPALARRLQDMLRETGSKIGIDGKRGPHRLRAAYAESFRDRRMHDGLSERAARQELTAQLGHTRIDVTYRSVPRR